MSTPVHKVLTENVLTLTEARKEIAKITKRRVDKATLTRWIHKGIGGIQLEAIRLGRNLFTSSQAITRFIEARTAKSIGRGRGR